VIILIRKASGRATRGFCEEEQVEGRQEDSANKNRWEGEVGERDTYIWLPVKDFCWLSNKMMYFYKVKFLN